MKKAFLFVAMLVMCGMCVTMTSCGDDEPTPTQQTGGDNNGVQPNDSTGGKEDNNGGLPNDSTAGKDTTTVVDAHEYVDLGLPSGTLWATCNVGASKPEEFGDYFAWGETNGYNSGKTMFAESTYKWCNGSMNTINKYCTNSEYGIVDYMAQLELSDDVAYVNWGRNWRMPTRDQLDELINDSYTTITDPIQNGVHGLKITSKKNRNSIFLPSAGRYQGTELIISGRDCGYWSRTLNSTRSYWAQFLYSTQTIGSNITVGSDVRYVGRSVRPVLNK